MRITSNLSIIKKLIRANVSSVNKSKENRATVTGRKLNGQLNFDEDAAAKSVDVTDSRAHDTAATPLREKENTTPSKLDTALVETPAPAIVSTNRFSFSKLTKFVSKSALKVMSRKLSSSPMSLDSSSSSSISSPATPSFDDEDTTKKATIVQQPPSIPPPPLPSTSQSQLQSQPQPVQIVSDSGIYKSEQQRLEMEKRLFRLIEDNRSHRNIFTAPHNWVCYYFYCFNMFKR